MKINRRFPVEDTGGHPWMILSFFRTTQVRPLYEVAYRLPHRPLHRRPTRGFLRKTP